MKGKLKAAAGYEKVLVFLAPYITAFSGLLAAWLTTQIGVFAAIGIPRGTVAHDIAEGLTALVTAVVAYIAQHKWLDNLQAWWRHLESMPGVESAEVKVLQDRLTALEKVVASDQVRFSEARFSGEVAGDPPVLRKSRAKPRGK